MAGMRFTIRSESNLIKAINRYGFLPFFRNSIEGFSIEEHIAPEHWYYSDSGQWDAWEWKGPVIQKTGCAYGKFFEHKAVYISKEWFSDFANYRRDGYDLRQEGCGSERKEKEEVSKQVTIIPAKLNCATFTPLDQPKKRKVAGYARVSTDSEEQQTSYEAQVSYYTEYIQKRDDWEFCGRIYGSGHLGDQYKAQRRF